MLTSGKNIKDEKGESKGGESGQASNLVSQVNLGSEVWVFKCTKLTTKT